VKTQKQYRLTRQPTSAKDILDEEAEKDRWYILYVPFFLQAFKKGVNIAKLALTEDQIISSTLIEGVKSKAFEHAALAIGTTKDVLQELIGKALKEGSGVRGLAKAIRDEFDSMAGYRPLRIARTELTEVINDGSAVALSKEGFSQKEWSTVIDGNERPTHAQANGQVVGVLEPFRVGGETCMFPGEESLSPGERINCRCTVVGAGMPEDRKRIIGEDFLRQHGALEKRFVVQLRREFLQQRDRILSRLPL